MIKRKTMHFYMHGFLNLTIMVIFFGRLSFF